MWSGNCGSGTPRNPSQFQHRESLPEKEVEEQRHNPSFSEFFQAAAQELLGHNDLDTRMIYTHVLIEVAKGFGLRRMDCERAGPVQVYWYDTDQVLDKTRMQTELTSCWSKR
jgi:hypothetical protein